MTCQKETVFVDEFMILRERDNSQHLTSHVKSVLQPNAGAWIASEKLFPVVRAGGIPEREPVETISRQEKHKWGYYNGCVLRTDSDGALNATLMLCSTYRDEDRYWLQIGAGLVFHSTHERKCEDVYEKLAVVIGPYLCVSKQ